MKKNSYLLRLMLLAVLSASALVSLPSAGAQTGLEQTPIDIRNEDLTFVPNLPALGFSYETGSPLSVVNNGSPDEFATVRAELLPGNTSKLTVAGANGDVDYKLLQFHFHAPSEHELNGQKFPLEMHLVHRADDGAGPISVVGVFVRAGKENSELAKIFSRLPAQPDERRAVARLNLTKLLPHGLESYRYDGSLTTPDPSGVFQEGVRWVVLAEPIEMSQQQIDAFRRLFPEGNSREVQPLNGRTILTDVEPAGN
jgi:carbonic anhydrase